MSFLNPVNEPVLRFSSTDVGAPQINYNARVAGDVKAVLKACLVTGYGAKSSAGWSIVNEVDHVAEFVSPSAAMSDYRLGINDTSTSSTTWYYYYQNSRTNPNYNTPSKSISYIDKTSPSNRWELIVSSRGFYFIEILMHSIVQQMVARVLWLGQVKSGMLSVGGLNMSYFSTGIGSQMSYPGNLMLSNTTSHKTYELGGITSLYFNTANYLAFDRGDVVRGESVIDVISDVYLSSPTYNIVAQQSSLLFKTVANDTDALGVADEILNDRPIISVSITRNSPSGGNTTITSSKKLLIRLDYWEY